MGARPELGPLGATAPLQNPRTATGHGLGLGLVVVHGLVQSGARVAPSGPSSARAPDEFTARMNVL